MTESTATAINAEFARLQVGTDQDPCSGLMAVDAENGTVKVFDDHADGIYNAAEVLAALQILDPEEVNLDSDSPNNIWQSLPAEV